MQPETQKSPSLSVPWPPAGSLCTQTVHVDPTCVSLSAPCRPEEHAKRARESLDRLQRDIKASVDRKSWPRVSADLRHQMGTLR